jgi:hypothetical protein
VLGGLAWGADTSLVADVDVEAGSGLRQSTSQRPVARLRSPRYKGVVYGLNTTSALASRCASHPASQSCPRDISDVCRHEPPKQGKPYVEDVSRLVMHHAGSKIGSFHVGNFQKSARCFFWQFFGSVGTPFPVGSFFRDIPNSKRQNRPHPTHTHHTQTQQPQKNVPLVSLMCRVLSSFWEEEDSLPLLPFLSPYPHK